MVTFENFRGKPQIFSINIETNESFDEIGAFFGRKSAVTDAQERVEDSAVFASVEANAFDGEFSWESRRMRSLFGALMDCFIRNEPGIAAATLVRAAGMRPPRNVAFVRVRHTDAKAVDF